MSPTGPSVKILLYLLIAIRNSSYENYGYEVDILFEISSSTSVLNCQC